MEPKNTELTYTSTVDDMPSDDRKRRFKAEYDQLSLRLKAEYDQLSLRLSRLNNTLESADQNDMGGTMHEQLGLLRIQACAMSTYKKVLEERAKLIGITL